MLRFRILQYQAMRHFQGIRNITPTSLHINNYPHEFFLFKPLCYHFKLQPSIVCGTPDSEKQENRWQNESWQQLIANGDRVRYLFFSI